MSDCMCFQKQQFNIFNVYIWYLAFCSELTTGESWNGLVQMEIFFHCYLCMTSSSSPACMFNKITLNGFNKEEAISGKVWLHAFSIKRIFESGFRRWRTRNGRLASENISFGRLKACTRWIRAWMCLKVHETRFQSFFQLRCLESLSSTMLKEVWHTLQLLHLIAMTKIKRNRWVNVKVTRGDPKTKKNQFKWQERIQRRIHPI